MEYSKEHYSLEIVHGDPEDGLTRPGMVETKIIGVRDLDDVKELRYMFQNLADKMKPAKVKIGRTIMFYCHSCRGFIGEKTIPLRIEQFRRYSTESSVETEIAIHSEMYRCIACGHHTRYNIPDPLISIY